MHLVSAYACQHARSFAGKRQQACWASIYQRVTLQAALYPSFCYLSSDSF
jgi:hypothetical protein